MKKFACIASLGVLLLSLTAFAQGEPAEEPVAAPAAATPAPAAPEEAAPAPAAPEEAAPASPAATESVPESPPGEPAAGPPERKERDPGMIEEIVVTATKRETTLQETALAVTALPGESLKRQQMVDLKSVTALVPNLQIGAHSDSAAVDVSLRGIVSTNRTELGDPAVAFHVNGLYSPRPQGATTLLYDVERLEVLRGPQGTLFGRNANAGVINVLTIKPRADATSASVDTTFGSYNLMRNQGHLNLPVHKTLALRAAFASDRRDGFIRFQPGSRVPAGSPRYDNSKQTAGRLSLQWEPLEAVSVFLTAEHYSNQGAGTIPVLVKPRDGTKRRSAVVDSPGELDLDNTTLGSRIDVRPIAFLEVTYLGAYGKMTRRNVSDNDVGYNVSDRFKQEHRTEWSNFLSQSHELQLKTMDLPYVDVIVGAFLYREDNNIRFDIDIETDPDHDDVPDEYWAMSFVQPDRQLDSIAGFGQATLKVLDNRLRLSGGARYSKDTKSDEGGLNLVCPAFGAQFDEGGVALARRDSLPLRDNVFGEYPHPNGTCGSFPTNEGNDVKKSWDAINWMSRAEFVPADGLLLYGLVSTGFKSGVIQDGGTTADPEYVTNYELGAKADLLGGAMNVAAVGFYSDYTDILRSRAERQDDGSQQMVTRNATEASILGVEAELLWYLTSADRLQLVLTYLNAEYKDFPNIDNVIYATDDDDSPVVNLKGNKLPFSPVISAALVFEHNFDLPNGASVVPRLQSQYRSEMYLNDFNRDSDRQAAYTRTDLSLRYVSESGWLAEVFVKNIEDVEVKSNVEIKGNSPGGGGVAGDPGHAFAYYDPPRTYGLRLAYRWED